MRYNAKCDGPLTDINQLRGPMSAILDHFMQQQNELARYRELYGPLPSQPAGSSSTLPAASPTGLGITEVGDEDGNDKEDDVGGTDGSDADSEGSDTEQD